MIFLPSVERDAYECLNSDGLSLRFVIDNLLYCQHADDSDTIKVLCLDSFEVDEAFLVIHDEFKVPDLLDSVHVHNGCVYAWNNEEEFLLEGKPELDEGDFHWRRIGSIGGKKFSGPSFSYEDGDASCLCAFDYFKDGDDNANLLLYRLNHSEESKEWVSVQAECSFKDQQAYRQVYRFFAMGDGFCDKVLVAGNHVHFFTTFYNDYDKYTASRRHLMIDLTTLECATNTSFDSLPSSAKIGAVDWALPRAYKDIKPSPNSQIFVYKDELWIVSTAKDRCKSLLHRCDRESGEWIKMVCISDDSSLFRVREAPIEHGSQIIFTRSATITGLSFEHSRFRKGFELSFDPCLHILEFEPTLCDRARAIISRDVRAARLAYKALPIRLRGFLAGKLRWHLKLDTWTAAQGEDGDDISEHSVQEDVEEEHEAPCQADCEEVDDDEAFWDRRLLESQRMADDLGMMLEWFLASARDNDRAGSEEPGDGSDLEEEPEGEITGVEESEDGRPSNPPAASPPPDAIAMRVGLREVLPDE